MARAAPRRPSTQAPSAPTPPDAPDPAAAAGPAATAAANAAADASAGLARQPFDALLQQGTAWLRSMEELHTLQLNTAHLALKRLEDLQQRLQAAASGAEIASLQAEFLRFEAAAATHFWQEFAELMLRSAARRTAQLGEAAPVALPAAALAPFASLASFAPLAASMPGAADWIGPLLGMIHTGIQPLDVVYGAALNRELVPPRPAV